MRLGILTTARCNAACSHCFTSCGPRRTESLSREQLLALMDQAASIANDQPLKFSFSGGEIFLDFDLLLELVAHGKQLGAVEVTCVTNGYWGASMERARTILSALREAGMTHFAVSTSRFHRQFIKRRRVENVLRAARDIGLPCSVKLAFTRSDAADVEAERRWAISAGAEELQELPVLPHLSAGTVLPEDEYERTPGLPEGRCPSPWLTVTETGDAYTCCVPDAFAPPLRLGHIRDSPLADLRQRFLLGGVQQILRTEGPIAFARAAQVRNLGDRLRTGYQGACDLCTHLATDPELARVVAEAGEAREIEQAQAVLRRIVEAPSTT
jgi:MoaA/NifB/PqqE/SkfB family radical SAM enzyme